MNGLALELEALVARLVEAELDRRLADLAPAADAWLSVREAARYLGYRDDELDRGCRRVYDLKARGLIRAHADGSRLVFRRSELDAYLEGSAA